MKHYMESRFGRVSLRPLQRDDIEDLRLLRNRERKWFVFSEEIDTESQNKWFEKYLQIQNDYMFSIYETSNPEIFIGTAALYNVDDAERTCEFGRIIIDGDKTSEKGLGFDATMCACLIGFEQLGMQKIALEVFDYNIKAIKTYQKSGFVIDSQQVGIIKMMLKREVFINIIKKEKED